VLELVTACHQSDAIEFERQLGRRRPNARVPVHERVVENQGVLCRGLGGG